MVDFIVDVFAEIVSFFVGIWVDKIINKVKVASRKSSVRKLSTEGAGAVPDVSIRNEQK